MARKIKFKAKWDGATVGWESTDGKPAKDHKTKIDHGADPEEIELKILVDQSAKSLKLRIDCGHPFQVWEDESCCPPAGIGTDQITVLSCDVDSVTISDSNTGQECTLRYQINVVDKEGNSHPCDPIIQNGGGGPGFQFD